MVHSYGLWINGRWVHTAKSMDVLDKYTQETIATVAVAESHHIHSMVDSAQAALKVPFHSYDRFKVLSKASSLLLERKQEFIETLVSEVGKPVREAQGEVERAAQTLLLSAEEAKRIHGQGVPVEAAPGSEGRMAFTIRVPVGVIAAITPFNVPLNLVCHKVGPALAAGNAVIVKPSELTPIVALKLAELLAEAGLPAGRLQVATGFGAEIGQWMVEHPNIRMFSFTGSVRTGKWIKEHAGVRKVSLELGNNAANIVHLDCKLDQAADMIAAKAFNNSGQVCISVQRVFVHEAVYDEFLSKLIDRTKRFVVGNPRDERTDIGPMISIQEAERVESWVQEAVRDGAKIEIGGKRDGAFYYPTILTGVKPDMKVCRMEVFGPVVTIDTYKTEDEVIAKANQSEYGLQAGVFTTNLDFAMKAARELEVGGVIINDASAYRVDLMPYGGIKNSGIGKEGPASAIKEMTEERIVVLNLG